MPNENNKNKFRSSIGIKPGAANYLIKLDHTLLTINFNLPGYDLALLTQANHSILTYGTYGMWGALLASGSALLPVSHLNTLVSEEIRAGNVTDWMFI